jgi:gamma-glutamyltranspeptidase/glutathione hydrolase
MPLDEAVEAPRLHVEDEVLSIEPPVDPGVLEGLRSRWPSLHAWTERSVFFGGAHSVSIFDDGELVGAGDSRRGGVVRFA